MIDTTGGNLMTRAPANLLAVRTLLLMHLDNAPGPDDLEPAEVGIVGDPDHRGGYHCGNDRVVTNDYSVVESSRDRDGLTDFSAALDVGKFRVTTAKGTFDLPHYSRWLVAECVKNAPDTRDIREVIYSPDGKTVKRWDRLGKRSSGDDSHLYHTHESYFRDAIKAGRDQRPVKIRYLKYIGILEEDDMDGTEREWLRQATESILWLRDYAYRALNGQDKATGGENIELAGWIREAQAERATMLANLAELRGKDWTNEPQIIAGVLQGLTPELFAQALVLANVTPEAFAASLPEAFAHDLIVALGRQLTGSAQPE